jgi:hypothetical protein
MDLQTDAALGVFQKGLQDGESVEVSHRVNFPLSSIPTSSRSVYYRRPFPVSPHPIQTNSRNLSHSCNRCSIPSPNAHLPKFLSTLTPLHKPPQSFDPTSLRPPRLPPRPHPPLRRPRSDHNSRASLPYTAFLVLVPTRTLPI